MSIVDVRNQIAQIEGYNVAGTIAQRCNNPGNLVFVGQAGATPCATAPQFASWGTPDKGFNALDNQIMLDAGRGLDVQSFIQKYDPVPSETSNYLNIFTTGLHAKPTDSLASLIGDVSNVTASTGDNVGDGAPGDSSPTDWTTIVLVGIIGVGLISLVS